MERLFLRRTDFNSRPGHKPGPFTVWCVVPSGIDMQKPGYREHLKHLHRVELYSRHWGLVIPQKGHRESR